MMFRKQIDEAREEFGQRAEAVTDQLRQTSDVVVYALVAVGVVAVMALVVAVTTASRNAGSA